AGGFAGLRGQGPDRGAAQDADHRRAPSRAVPRGPSPRRFATLQPAIHAGVGHRLSGRRQLWNANLLPASRCGAHQQPEHLEDAVTMHRSTRPGGVAIVAALIALAGPRSARAQEPYPGLDAYIAKAVQTWKIPGMSVAIVRNDSVVYTKGFGTLSAQNHAVVNDQTLFEIGSSSKAFTATLVAMLVTDGEMRWEDHLSEYLPGLRMYDPVANEGVTLRDALTHRSGIARGELVWLGSGISRDDVLHRVRFLKPESPFRSKYSYQNMMFLAAGQAAGKAAGSSWDALIPQRIFGPLGMTSSVTTSKGLATPNVARPHTLDHDAPLVEDMFDGENIGPAGSILSNAKDMAQWLRFQLNDGVVNGKRLVNSTALRETHAPQILAASGAPPAGRGGGGNPAGADSI